MPDDAKEVLDGGHSRILQLSSTYPTNPNPRVKLHNLKHALSQADAL